MMLNAKTMLSSGLHALLTHADQLADVRADASLIPGAVEEILRWANPLHYFRRTAAADTELQGQQIKAGDKVAMYYTSANRDEKLFEDSQSFRITRPSFITNLTCSSARMLSRGLSGTATMSARFPVSMAPISLSTSEPSA